jgi:1,6-anhydro-N-acetylmuramate kinase
MIGSKPSEMNDAPPHPTAAPIHAAPARECGFTASVVNTENGGQDGDPFEAYMIANLAARYFGSLPISFHATTGADRPCPGGELFLPGGAKSDSIE